MTATIKTSLGFSTRNGLPASNGDFGARNVDYYFNSAWFQSAPVEIFYEATAHTHPIGGPVKGFMHAEVGGTHGSNEEIDTANFIYYYNQSYPSPVKIEDWVDTANTGDEAYYFPGDDHIHIGRAVQSIHLTARFEHADPSDATSALSWVGWEETYGIDTFARLIAHENKHKWIYENFHQSIIDAENDAVPDILVDANGDQILDVNNHWQANDPNADPDNDDLPTWFERANGLDPTQKFSTTLNTAFANTSYADDEEVIVRLAENGVFGPRELDWADNGLNHGTKPNQSLHERTRILDTNQTFLYWTYGGP